ncbi:MAG: hypothetical protein CSA66_00010 [Proteobacteria bacterium]|nr:MAG: hypothetical protein CSA66_00010 [Pseudomonadota bacterium]
MADTPPQSTESQRLQHLSALAARAFAGSGLQGFEAEVVIALDISAPMAPLYLSGSIQDLVASLLALGLRFDDDGVLPAWVFAAQTRPITPLTCGAMAGWIEREVLPTAQFEPTCRYAAAIEAICRKYFPREWAMPVTTKQVGGALKRTVREFPRLVDRRPYAVFAIVLTGGDCADPTETIRAIQRASRLPIFFQFAGIHPAGMTGAEFAFLRRLDRLSDRWVDNCGFFEPNDFRDPCELFGGLLNEFPTYLTHQRVRDMLLPPSEPAATAPLALTSGLTSQLDDAPPERQAAAEARASPAARPIPSIGPRPADARPKHQARRTQPYCKAEAPKPVTPQTKRPRRGRRTKSLSEGAPTMIDAVPAARRPTRQELPSAPHQRPTRRELEPAPAPDAPLRPGPSAPIPASRAQTAPQPTAAPAPSGGGAAARLARIRARRAARRARLANRTSSPSDDPTAR